MATARAARRLLVGDRSALRAGINMSNFLLVSEPDGESSRGVAPSLAHAIGEKLNVPVVLVPFSNPGALCANMASWDLGLIGSEPQRAETIHFTPAYAEIEISYMVPPGSAIQHVEDVDRLDNRVAASRGAAYELWLSRNLAQAELQLTGEPSLPGSFTLFKEQNLEALAGLRSWLMEQSSDMPGSRVLPGSFMSVQQAVGVARDRLLGEEGEEVQAFLDDFIQDVKRSGMVANLIASYGMSEKLAVPA